MVSAITALTLTYSFGGQTLSTGDFGEMHIALKSSKLFKKSILIWNCKNKSTIVVIFLKIPTCHRYLTPPKRRSCQKYDEDFFKFCGLLRKPKLL